jgi:hypothetical protein
MDRPLVILFRNVGTGATAYEEGRHSERTEAKTLLVETNSRWREDKESVLVAC